MTMIFGVSRDELNETRDALAKRLEERPNAGSSMTVRKKLALEWLKGRKGTFTGHQVAEGIGCFEHEATRALNSLRHAGLVAMGSSIHSTRGPATSTWRLRGES